MATEIVLPALAPSMTEGTLSRWLKKEGDPVKLGEALAEIETDKALVELEATTEGILAKILIKDGTPNVKVDTVIGMMAVSEEQVAPAPVVQPEAAPSTSSVIPLMTVAAHAATAGTGTDDARVFASPLARRLAQQHDIDLHTLQGSGPRGRVVRVDIDHVLQTGKGRSAQAASVASIAPVRKEVPASAWQDIPHSAMRRTIAQRLSESKREVPHFYLTVDCEVDALVAMRREINAVVEDGRKISVNDFIVKAVAAAMRKVPAVNASWTESAVRQYDEVDISVAVATQGGLITPVVRGADRKSIGTIASEVRSLAERARQGKLQPQEYQGGGFTISNLGMYGIREFAAIINPPQACILAVGAAEPRPVVMNGELAVATVMSCTLSADHRVVDGSVGAEFMAEFKALIEKPHAILL